MLSSLPWDSSGSEEEDNESEEILLLLAACKPMRVWVHETNLKRNELGEFHVLFEQMRKNDSHFKEYFGLHIQQFDQLLSLIRGDIEKRSMSFRQSIPAVERLAVCLRYLASGISFSSLSHSYRIGKSTIPSIVSNVCTVIWNWLQPIHMPDPNEEVWKASERGFREKWSLPHCVASLTGKYIGIKASHRKRPSKSSLDFNQESIPVFLLVASNYRFLAADSGQYGDTYKSDAFNCSEMSKQLIENTVNIPRAQRFGDCELPFVIVASNSAFPLKSYLLRPYSSRDQADDRRYLNEKLSKARDVAEDALSVLGNNWKVLLRPLHCHANIATKVVKATVILHNYMYEKTDISSEIPLSCKWKRSRFMDIDSYNYRPTKQALEVREKFTNCYSRLRESSSKFQ